MSKCVFKCDGCGKEGDGVFYRGDHAWHKPESWFTRDDAEGVQIACSRKCIDQIAGDTHVTRGILPI